jgi:hypothetical protein
MPASAALLNLWIHSNSFRLDPLKLRGMIVGVIYNFQSVI